MPAVIDCPACRHQTPMPDEVVEGKFQCPACRLLFDAHPRQSDSATAFSPAPPAPRPNVPEEDEDQRPWEQPGAPVRRDCEPHRGKLLVAFGIAGLAATSMCALVAMPFAVLAWVLAHRDLGKMDRGEMDPAGRGLTQAARACGITGTILDSIYALFILAYFGFVIYVLTTIGNKPLNQPPAAPPTKKSVAPAPQKDVAAPPKGAPKQ